MAWEVTVTHKPTTLPRATIQSSIIAVASNSDPNKTYSVVVGPRGGLKCPCLGFTHRHTCKHIATAREVLQRQK